MQKIIIASDSSCDLSKELVEKYGIKVFPYNVMLGENQYKDGVDVFPEDIYKYKEQTGNLAKTAAINMAEAAEIFEDLKKEAEEVVFFSLSSGMSGTNQYLKTAAEDFPGVYVVDSQNLSTGNGLSVIKAAEMAAEGKSAKEIAEYMENYYVPRVNASFVLDSLEYLHKGGRCSGVAALGANMLKLKPCIEVKNGVMGVGKKYRGTYDSVLINNYVPDRLSDLENLDLTRCFVTHSGVSEQTVNEVVKKVKETAPFNEILVTRAGATISVHCGPGVLGILFAEKEPIA